MGFPVVKDSLCGCGLKTGSRIVAWLSLLSAILSIVFGVVDMAEIRDFEDDLDSHFKTILAATYWTTIIVSILILFATLALLMGIDREQPSYMLPWLFIKTFTVIISLASNITLIVIISVSVERVGSIIDQCLSAYMLLIVFSYNRTLKEEAPNYT